MKKKSEFPKIYETYIQPAGFTLHNEPSAINGRANVERYRITVEIIDEPNEVICKRIQDLWNSTTNHHQWQPLQDKAKKYGYTLKGEMGNKVKR